MIYLSYETSLVWSGLYNLIGIETGPENPLPIQTLGKSTLEPTSILLTILPPAARIPPRPLTAFLVVPPGKAAAPFPAKSVRKSAIPVIPDPILPPISAPFPPAKAPPISLGAVSIRLLILLDPTICPNCPNIGLATDVILSKKD